MFNTNERVRSRKSGENRSHHGSAHPHGGLPHPRKQQLRSQVQHNKQADGISNVSRRSTTLPNPEVRPHGRVRVQAGAGDKCVPPGKSKQKKRTAVPGRPVDTSGLSMDAIVWSEETYNVEELITTYGNRFPIIVKVTHGSMISIEEELCIDQVFQIQSCGKEERIRATTENHGGKLSLPVTYPIQIFTKEEEIQERLSLQSAIAEKQLPLRALVTSVDEMEVSSVSVLGRNLIFLQRQIEYFLRANIIIDGWINQQKIQAIPGFVGLKFSVGVGMRGATNEEWMDYYGMFARSVRHLNFQLLRGYEGIIIEEDGDETIQPSSQSISVPVYENIAVDANAHHAFTLHPNTIYNVDKTVENGSSDTVSDVNNQEMKSAGMASVNTGFDVPPAVSNTNKHTTVKQNQNICGTGIVVVQAESPIQSQNIPIAQSSPRPGTPFSEVDEEDVEGMFQSVLDVADEQDSFRQPKNENVETIQFETVSTKSKVNVDPSSVHVMIKNNNDNKWLSDRNQALTPNTMNQLKAKHPRDLTISFSKSKSGRSSNNSIEILPNLDTDEKIQSDLLEMKDIPKNIDKLSVNDVCQCLHLLNMNCHMSDFTKHQIDGHLLSCINESTLMNKFKFTPFNASKLIRFVRGWRPEVK